MIGNDDQLRATEAHRFKAAQVEHDLVSRRRRKSQRTIHFRHGSVVQYAAYRDMSDVTDDRAPP